MKRLAAILAVAAGLAGVVPASADAAPLPGDNLICHATNAWPLGAFGVKLVPYCE
jgi:hypothetical protein